MAPEDFPRPDAGQSSGSSANPEFEQLAPADAYLSYYDVRLTKEDIVVLKNGWLTDNIIAFWEEYLEQEFLSSYKYSHIVLLRPTMCMMLMHTPDARTIKDALPDFSKTTHIFIPVSDSTDLEHAESGSHWSLLLVSVVDGVSFHYDSMPPGNVSDGQKATQKLSILLNKPLKFINLSDSPEQDNGSDCGVFVCLNMRHLLMKRLLQVRADEKEKRQSAFKKVEESSKDRFTDEAVKAASTDRVSSTSKLNWTELAT